MKKEEGITLLALVITIIVLLILAGVGIGATSGQKSSIKESKDAVAIGDIKKVQQAVSEVYIKYMNTKNTALLKGTRMPYSDAEAIADEFDNLDESKKIELRQESYDLSTGSPEIFYYKLNTSDLRQIGISNFEEGTEYIVNYSTGEVFNNTLKKTALGNILYVYVK